MTGLFGENIKDAYCLVNQQQCGMLGMYSVNDGAKNAVFSVSVAFLYVSLIRCSDYCSNGERRQKNFHTNSMVPVHCMLNGFQPLVSSRVYKSMSDSHEHLNLPLIQTLRGAGGCG